MIVSLGDLQTVHCTVQGSLTVIVLHNALLMQQPFFRTLGSLCGTLGIDFFRQFDGITQHQHIVPTHFGKALADRRIVPIRPSTVGNTSCSAAPT